MAVSVLQTKEEAEESVKNFGRGSTIFGRYVAVDVGKATASIIKGNV